MGGGAWERLLGPRGWTFREAKRRRKTFSQIYGHGFFFCFLSPCGSLEEEEEEEEWAWEGEEGEEENWAN